MHIQRFVRRSRLSTACLFAAFGLTLELPASAAPAPRPGDWVTYQVPGTQRALCASVASVDTGADGLPWAWIVERDAAMRVYKVPIVDLGEGCPR